MCIRDRGTRPAKVACNPATAHLFCESVLWDEALTKLTRMGDASSTHDPREKPAATRGTKRKAKRDYVLLLMVEAVGDADHESFLTLLKNSCDATVHEHCFMKNGTRHVTLAQLTEDEAERIRFSSAPMLPLELVLAKPQPWGAGLYLSLSEAAQQTIADLVRKLDPAPLKTTDSYRKQLHLSLYRGFNRGEALKQQLKKTEMKSAWKDRTSFGTVRGAAVAIKEKGADYDTMRYLMLPQ